MKAFGVARVGTNEAQLGFALAERPASRSDALGGTSLPGDMAWPIDHSEWPQGPVLLLCWRNTYGPEA